MQVGAPRRCRQGTLPFATATPLPWARPCRKQCRQRRVACAVQSPVEPAGQLSQDQDVCMGFNATSCTPLCTWIAGCMCVCAGMLGGLLEQAAETIATLEASDRSLLTRLGQNWCDQLQLEEGFIHSVYHHMCTYLASVPLFAASTLCKQWGRRLALGAFVKHVSMEILLGTAARNCA